MRQRNVRRRLLGLIGAGALLVLANTIGLLKPFTSAASVVARPFQSAVNDAGNSAANWFEVVGTAGKLGEENRRLKAEIASLRQTISQDTELRAQNDELRKQLGVGGVRSDRLVAAEVIAYQPDNFRQFITIGRGERDGIKPGMAVVQQGALVGKIQDVTPTTAKVFLLIDPNFRVAAIDQDAPNRPSGTVYGRIGGGLVMDKIAQTEQVKPGDTIITSGLGGDVEKGLIIGRVQTVDKKDNGVFQSAQVTSNVQFSRLEVVYVVARPE